MADGVFVEHKGKEDEIAFLQYTSGSTGQPKGVTLTHANLLANIRAMGEATEVDSTDIFVSWLPLYHDMGLIGAWFTSLYYAMPLVLMSPLSFLVQPSRWLWTIANHRGSISAAPNFAFELCLKKIPEEKLKNLDLSSLRFLFNGAEPVSPRTIRQFSNKFVKYGFKARALAPVYGLAEVAVGLAFPPPDREPVIDRIQREVLVSKGIAIPVVRQVGEGDDVLEIVACGQPLPGYQIRIVDGAGREVPDRQQGRLEFKGPSATSGYYRNAKATKALFHGKWLDSGDLAYSSEGDIFLTSRVKDIIIRAGRNLYPHQLEEAIGNIEGVRKGCVAVFGATDSVSETEKLVIVAETRLKNENESTRLRKEIDLLAIDILGMPTDDIVIAPPHTVLKTSSGKIRRSAVRELYERGDMFLHPRHLWWQLARLFAKAFASRFQILNRLCKEYLYAGYVKTIFWVLAPSVWLLVAISPNGNTARFIMRQAARLFLKLCSVPVDVTGLEGLPKQRACVIVANHTSYLDGIIIASILPIEFGFVAKGELKKKFFPRVFLRKIDAVFVERFDKQRGVADARRAAAKVKQGLSLFFFPEGTLTRVPGLLPFYMGAFVAATESNVPVIPVAIKGARSILRSGSWFPHKGKISIVISPAISPVGDDWKSAVNLSKQARIAILSQLNEPDLAAEKIKGVATTL
ncbi:AMP-binding protein [Alkalimarinus coralli]|uniref:AMP-binding protein n=1 Tax=Alkalimarinus coralli TaxID=2935863 RepID=UPI00202AE68B|nr:AMP-binding protein [Alkalimarinus coralli]